MRLEETTCETLKTRSAFLGWLLVPRPLPRPCGRGSPDREVHTSAAAETALLLGLVAIIAAPFPSCMAPSSFLCMIRRGRAGALTLRDLADPPKMSAVLAAQAPAWTPGTRHGYHAVTLGWYESELIRHADPLGRSLGQFFADEVAKPLGLEFYIGLPASVDRDRQR
jgi:hypothetical protein